MDNLFVLLVPLVFATVASSSLLLSIDCGASKPHTDENGIKWVPDTAYISNGESYGVKTTGPVPDSLKTLRVFASRKKNCYPIPVDVTLGTKILLRAGFYYGDYDGKSSPPSFELMFEGNHWATVHTQTDDEVHHEAVFLVGENGTSLCVAQSKPGQLPFVSTIQVSELEANMYVHSSADWHSALFLQQRVAFGSPRTVRYSDDPYDRIWVPNMAPANSLAIVNTEITSVDMLFSDNPPLAVLQTAVTSAGLSSSIPLPVNLPADPVTVYMNLYFADMSQGGDLLDVRSVSLFVDGQQITDPMSVIYGQVTEYYVSNFTASASSEFSLKATSDSTVPPIINAMEVFSVSEELSGGTDSFDVDGLVALMGKFEALKDWSGDPCLPRPYNWDWVGCSSDDPPRITALYLNGLGLSGEIPDFSIMFALETIDMQNNSLTGEIPEFLGLLPNLKELNLADNNLNGPLPFSLVDNNRIRLVITGNPMCESGQSCETSSNDGTSNSPMSGESSSSSKNTATKKNKSNLGLILGLSVPLSFIFIVAAVVTLFLYSRRGVVTNAAVNPGPPIPPVTNGGPNSKPIGNSNPVENSGEEGAKVDEDVVQVVVEMEEAETTEETYGEQSA